MKAISLPQPAATLTVTRAPCHDDRYDTAWLRCTTCGPGKSPPMVSRWVTFDYVCPSDLIGQRIAIAANDEPVTHRTQVGDWIVRNHGTLYNRDLWLHHDDGRPAIRTPLGVVVGSAIVEASYPIAHQLGEREYSKMVHVSTAIGGEISLHLGDDWDGWNETITDQLPYADWLPGRFAWLLGDAAPCQERCPWIECADGQILYPHDYRPCPVCKGAGRCEPVSWVSSGGRLPEWNPNPKENP